MEDRFTKPEHGGTGHRVSMAGLTSHRKMSMRRESKAQRMSQTRRKSQHRRGSTMPRHSQSRGRNPGEMSPSSEHSAAEKNQGDLSPSSGCRPRFNVDIGSEQERSVDESYKDAITDVQAQPWIRHDEHSESEDSDLPDERAEGDTSFAEQRQMFHHQKRASGLSVVSRTKVLRGVPTRLQVLFARQLKCVYFGPEDEEVLCRAGDNSITTNRFMVLDDGVCDVLVPGPDGQEVVIGRVGPGSVIGGTLALGLTSTHLMTIRRARVRAKDSKLEAAEGDRDDDSNTRPIELITHVIHSNDVAQLEDQFKEELDVLRKRVLLDLQRFVVPHLQRLSSHGFFRRYCSAFVKRVVKNMDMRICRPSELIFKENLLAQSMAILFCGKIDFFVAGKKVATQGEPGMCFGEAALLEDHAVRAASVRCNSEADCLICLLRKEDFLQALNDFPEEKNRLEEQVKTKLTRLSMQSVFTGCERNFLHFLSATADAVELLPEQLAYMDSETNEALFICQRGELVVSKPSEPDRALHKGEAVGFEAALGLREGPPEYFLKAGANGCLLIRLTYSVLEQALIYFPGQLPAVLSVLGLTQLPEDHPFSKRQNDIWNIVRPLLCQAFMTLDIDESLCRTLAPFFKPEICDPGCTITEEGKESDEMVLLVHGTVNWSTSDKVTTVAKAPRHFDEGLVMGTQRRHTATITAKSTCVLWLLSAEHVAEMKTRHWSVCKIFEEAAALRRSMQLHLQARLRNMKTFRRFRSEILEVISRNMDIRTYLPRDVIFAAGEEGDCMYILLQGKAEASVNGRIGQLDEGSTFGEMCLFGQVKRTMTVSSASLCICNVVHRDIITYAFTQFPDDKNANRDLGGPPMSRGISGFGALGGRAKDSAEKTLAKKGSKRESRREFQKQLNKEGGASRISLRTLDACCRANLVQTPPDGGKTRSSRGRISGAIAARNSKLFQAGTSNSNSQIMSRNSIKAAERKSARATIFNKVPYEDDELSTSSSSDSSDREDGRTHVVKLGRTSWIKSGPPSNRSSFPLQEQNNSSQASKMKELDAALSECELAQDEQVEEPAGGPQELQRRFQHRSCLFDVPTPKVPPADEGLYYVRKETEEKFSSAFRSYMPAGAAATSARVHGVPSASRRDKNGSRHDPGSGLNDSTMSIGSGRAQHVGATYTSPLPPIHHARPPGTAIIAGARPKERERSIAIAGHLQMLASSLLRINNKPTLTSLNLEELQKGIVEDKSLQSGVRELCRDTSYGTWTDSDSSDDIRTYWHPKRNKAEVSGEISTESMRAITAPMATRSEKRAHLKRSYLALPVTPSMPKKPGKQRPRPMNVRMYEGATYDEELGSPGGAVVRQLLGAEQPMEADRGVTELASEMEKWQETASDLERELDKEQAKQRGSKGHEPMEPEMRPAQVCRLIRSSLWRKLAPKQEVKKSLKPTLPIQSVTDRSSPPDSEKGQTDSAAIAIQEEPEYSFPVYYSEESHSAEYELEKNHEVAKSLNAQANEEQMRAEREIAEQDCREAEELAEEQCRAEELQHTAEKRAEVKRAVVYVRRHMLHAAAYSPRAAPENFESTEGIESAPPAEAEAIEAPKAELTPDATEEHAVTRSPSPKIDAVTAPSEEAPSTETEPGLCHPMEEEPGPDEVPRSGSPAAEMQGVAIVPNEEEEDAVCMMAATLSFVTCVVVKVAHKLNMHRQIWPICEDTVDEVSPALLKPSVATWKYPLPMRGRGHPGGRARTSSQVRCISEGITDEQAEMMASAASGCSRPPTRKKAPKQEALEGEPLLPQDEEPPKAATERHRRVRITNPAEERAQRVAVGYCIRLGCYQQASRNMRKEDSLVAHFLRKTWIERASRAGNMPVE